MRISGESARHLSPIGFPLTAACPRPPPLTRVNVPLVPEALLVVWCCTSSTSPRRGSPSSLPALPAAWGSSAPTATCTRREEQQSAPVWCCGALQVLRECPGPVTSDFRGTDGGRRAGGKAIKSYFCVSHRDPQLHVIRSQESIGCALKGSKNLKPSRNLGPGRHVKFEQVIMDTTNQAPPQSNSSEIEKLK